MPDHQKLDRHGLPSSRQEKLRIMDMKQQGTLKRKRFNVHYHYVIVASVFAIWGAIFGMTSTFSVFFKPISTEFGWGRTVLATVYSFYILLNGFLGIIMGKLSDKFGPRMVLLVCSLFLGLGLALMSTVHTVWQIYVFYGLLMSIGTSANISPLESTIGRWFTKRRGLMVGICLMGMSSGGMVMPPIANWLISLYGWRTAYIILDIVILSIVVSAALFLKRDPAQMGLLPYGYALQDEEKCKASSKHKDGFSLGEAFQKAEFWFACLLFFCYGFIIISVMTHIVPYATDIGISSTIASIILACIGGASTATRIPEGLMADRIGVRKAGIVLTSFMVGSMLWLLMEGRQAWTLFLFAIIFGVAFSGLDILLTLLPSSLFGVRALGAIIGFMNFAFTIGGAVGSSITGLSFDLTGDYRAALLLCTAVSGVALIASWVLGTGRWANHD